MSQVEQVQELPQVKNLSHEVWLFAPVGREQD